MNGAESLIKTLVRNDVSVCFANPGTTELHIVAALDKNPNIRSILGLFEGVVTGAADGYARISGKPSCTLLHLGPGFANGIAYLHNARRAYSPVINIIGDHASYHIKYDAPLTSDIESLARPVSGWVKTSQSSSELPGDGIEALQASYDKGGQVASLIVPADCAWQESPEHGGVVEKSILRIVQPEKIKDVVALLEEKAESTVLIIGGSVLQKEGLEAAGKIAKKTGATVLCETLPAKIERGAGIVSFDRIPYLTEIARQVLAPFKHCITICAKSPVSFFAYPDKNSVLLPEGCVHTELAIMGEDGIAALDALADELGAIELPEISELNIPDLPSGLLDTDKAGAIIARLIPENAIISDESITSGLSAAIYSRTSQPHEWMSVTGGAIGQGMPVATGAAVAAPGRKVLCLQSDGGAMYTFQALWTQAREQLDVVTIIFSNRKYAILEMELANLGLNEIGEKGRDLIELTRPTLDFVSLAAGLGVSAVRADTAEYFSRELKGALAGKGPYLIEAVV